MNIPEDERAFYDAARQENLDADRPPAPQMSDDQRRYLQVVSHQAAHTLEHAPDLLAHLDRMSHTVIPAGASNAAEVALFRAGIAHATFTIRNAAQWPGENDG